MAIKSGFFNSSAGDRKYDAEDINKFFDGVITDGVFSAIGDIFLVVPSSGMQIAVGSGKAWFLRSWIENSSDAFRTLSDSDVTFDRIDIIALDFDKSDQVRENDIIVVEGTPAGSPVPPTLIDTSTHLQKPLAHILVGANETVIDSGDITIKVDTVDCPFSTGIVDLLVEVDDVTIEIIANELRVKNDGITADKIAANAVDSEHYTNLSIDREHLEADIIDATKIADNALNTEHYVNGSIGENHIADEAVTDAKLRDAAATSVIGRAAGSSGAPADIAAGSNYHVLRRFANALSFGLIGGNSIEADSIDDTKVGNRVPMLTRRKGGNATNWYIKGPTTYTPTTVKIQVGSHEGPTVAAQDSEIIDITFPQAFSYAPVVFVQPFGGLQFTTAISPTASQVYITGFNNDPSLSKDFDFHWLAIGPE